MTGRPGNGVLVAAVVALLAAAPAVAVAQGLDLDLRVGARGGDAFAGAGLLTGLGARGWSFNPSLEWVFVERGDLIVLNADVQYDLRPSGGLDAWLGGGPALVRREPERGGGKTDVALNLLAGVGLLPGSTVRPYVLGRIVLADDSEAVLAFGVRF